MGASLAGGGGGGRRRRGSRRHGGASAGRMSEINVTPFVDVMLVLLIVFMVAAPMLTVGVPIDMPKTSANPMEQDKEPLSVTIDIDGRLYLQDTEITAEELVPRLLAIAENGYKEQIFLRADGGINYARVMEVMAMLSSAGFTKIGLVTDPLPAGAAKPGAMRPSNG